MTVDSHPRFQRSSRSVLFALAIWGAMAIAGGMLMQTSPAYAGQEVMIDGVLHVKNGPSPAGGTETLQLRELWRAGGEDDDEFFGIITRALSDDDGNIYLLDTQLSEVRIYSPDGEFLKTLSREGDGPGETRQPRDLFFLPDGSLGLVQQFPGKIVCIDRDGNPTHDMTPGGHDPTKGGFLALVDARSSGTQMVIGGLEVSMNQEEGYQDRTCFLASFDADGEEKTRYLNFDYKWVFSNWVLDEWELMYVWTRWAMDRDGRVLVPLPRNEYAIKVFNPDGSVDRIIEREYESWKRQESDWFFINSIIEAIKRQIPLEVKDHTEQTEPDIAQIHPMDDGTTWVLSSRSIREQPAGTFATFEVFDQAGHFTKQVAVACEGDAVRDGLFFIGNNRVIQVTGLIDAIIVLIGGSGASAEEDGEEPAPMEVICYSYD